MVPNLIVIIGLALTLLVGFSLGYFISRMQIERARRQQHEQADKILVEVREQAKTIEIQARDNALSKE